MGPRRGGALPRARSSSSTVKNQTKDPSTKAYDTAVAGVVSDQPGLTSWNRRDVDKAKIATTGRVKVRVDARTHPVERSAISWSPATSPAPPCSPSPSTSAA